MSLIKSSEIMKSWPVSKLWLHFLFLFIIQLFTLWLSLINFFILYWQTDRERQRVGRPPIVWCDANVFSIELIYNFFSTSGYLFAESYITIKYYYDELLLHKEGIWNQDYITLHFFKIKVEWRCYFDTLLST
jgi:hypothetical protein